MHSSEEPPTVLLEPLAEGQTTIIRPVVVPTVEPPGRPPRRDRLPRSIVRAAELPAVSRLVRASGLAWLSRWSRSPRSYRARMSIGAVVVLAGVAALVLLALTCALALVQPLPPGAPAPTPARELARLTGVLALGLLGTATLTGPLRRLPQLSRLSPMSPTPSRLSTAHTGLGVLSVVVTAGHLAATFAAPELRIGVLQLLVPGTRANAPLAQACGVLAWYLMLAVVVTSGLRRILPWHWWRAVHHTSLPLFGLACLHAVFAEEPDGSDGSPVLCVAVALWLIALSCHQLVRRDPAAEPATPVDPTGIPTHLFPAQPDPAGTSAEGEAGPVAAGPSPATLVLSAARFPLSPTERTMVPALPAAMAAVPVPVAPAEKVTDRAAGDPDPDGELDRCSLSLLVARATWEASGVLSLELTGEPGELLPVWQPGAHIQVVVPSGRLRLYSLCGDPTDRFRYRLAILRQNAGRGASAEIHDELRVGDRLMVSPPRNGFALRPAPCYLFLAGGIGITAILPMARAVLGTGVPWRMFYVGTTRPVMAFADEAAALHPYRVRVWPEDVYGRLELRRVVEVLPPRTEVYCCGPTGMIDELRALVAARPDLRLHTEGFAAGPVGPALGSSTVTVRLARSDRTVDVAPGQTILRALTASVPSLAGGCEQGVCGRCVVRVLDGEPEHRDTLLSAGQRAAGQMLPCVSRATTPHLTLDL